MATRCACADATGPGFDSTSPFTTTCNRLRKDVSYDNFKEEQMKIDVRNIFRCMPHSISQCSIMKVFRQCSIVFNSIFRATDLDKAWASAKQVLLHATDPDDVWASAKHTPKVLLHATNSDEDVWASAKHTPSLKEVLLQGWYAFNFFHLLTFTDFLDGKTYYFYWPYCWNGYDFYWLSVNQGFTCRTHP